MNESDRLGVPYTFPATFGHAPMVLDLDTLDADVAIYGVPSDIATQFRPGARFGPKGIREGSALCLISPAEPYDPEDDCTYFGPQWRIVDCGDAKMLHGDLETSFDNTRDLVRKIVSKGAMPVGLGGDHSVTIPILEALHDQGPFGIIQFDAHLDFVDSRNGQRNGNGSPMRRASEMDHVTKFAQLGIHGQGSSQKSDFEAAREYGSVIMSPLEIRAAGTQGTLDKIPKCDKYYVTIDIDGMDGSIATGTGTPAFGGLLYDEVRALLKGIAGLGEIVGFDMVEVAPIYDRTDATTMLAARLVTDFLGYILKAREQNRG